MKQLFQLIKLKLKLIALCKNAHFCNANIEVLDINLQKAISYKKQSGFSLIELMVALVIGLIMSLAIYKVLTDFEGRKRTTNSVGSIDQAGTYALYQLDKKIRSAGSGFSAGVGTTKAADSTYGCQLNAVTGGVQMLPKTSAFTGAFSAVNTTIRLAPVIIYDDAAGTAGINGDVIITMAGNSGAAEVFTDLTGVASSSQLNVDNNLNFNANNLVLVARKPVATAIQPCLIEQVATGFAPSATATSVALSGTSYASTINSIALTSYTANTLAVNLGQSPMFEMFAVGDNNILFGYDLLKPYDATLTNATANPAIVIEGAYQMHALYGVDSDNNSITPSLTWVAPTGSYSAANLLAGTVAANTLLSTIKAIKVGLVTRTALLEKPNPDGTPVSGAAGATVTLFGNTSVPVTVTLANTNYRYRVSESIIPMRNALMLENYIFN